MRDFSTPVDGEEDLLIRHRGLVVRFVRQYAGRVVYHPWLSEEDLDAAGMMGLLYAIRTFDADQGVAFTSFAFPRIRGAIQDAIRGIDALGRLTRTRWRRVSRASDQLYTRLCREPSSQEIASAIGEDPREVSSWISEHHVRCAEREDCGNSVTMPAVLRDEQFDAILARALAKLTRQERIVIDAYYWNEMSLREIGEVSIGGVTESRAFQVRRGALRKLRTRLERAGITFSDGVSE